MKVLTIISHTEHYKTSNGTIVGLGSTVTEINKLIEIFDQVYHVAMLHKDQAPPSALPYTSNKIKFVPIPAVGGPKLMDKIAILWKAPKITYIIHKCLKHSDYFQFRAPTGIGVFAIPYLILFSSKKGWFKYAGNWNQSKPPLAYRFQKRLLKWQNRVVTINGTWQNQAKHCLTFENPCLSKNEITQGHEITKRKHLDSNGIGLCFVGRLEEEKGIVILINALKQLDEDEKSKIVTVHIVGDGKLKSNYVQMARNSGLNFIFHGFLPRTSVQSIYIKSHLIVLPSASEGFPKVIAEAMNFGCLPIVSNVSGISNYIEHLRNGLLLETISSDNLLVQLKTAIKLSNKEYTNMINFKREDLKKFSYAYYNKRIVNDILN